MEISYAKKYRRDPVDLTVDMVKTLATVAGVKEPAKRLLDAAKKARSIIPVAAELALFQLKEAAAEVCFVHFPLTWSDSRLGAVHASR